MNDRVSPRKAEAVNESDDMDRLDTPEEQAAMFDAWAAGDGPMELQAELDELERTDPAVARAAESYDRMVERLTGRTLPVRKMP